MLGPPTRPLYPMAPNQSHSGSFGRLLLGRAGPVTHCTSFCGPQNGLQKSPKTTSSFRRLLLVCLLPVLRPTEVSRVGCWPGATQKKPPWHHWKRCDPPKRMRWVMAQLRLGMTDLKNQCGIMAGLIQPWLV